MSIPAPSLRITSLMGLALVGSWLIPAPTQAGLHKHRQKTYVPTYAQQAPAPSYSAAPAPVAYTSQAPMTYSAPAPTYYAAPAPAPVYSAPAPVYSAPAPVYSAPASVYSAPAPAAYAAPVQMQAQAPPQAQLFVGNAPGAVGNAPGANAGSRIKAVDRADIIEELRSEYREGGTDGTRRERRNTLRESARSKYSEALSASLGEDVEDLNDTELQEIEHIVNSIVDSTMAQTGKGQMAPGEAPYGYSTPPENYAPVYSAATYILVMQAPLIQPVVPVQLWVPVQPKHKLFHHKNTH